MSSEVVYLYGLVPAAAPHPPPDLAGVGGARVELLPVAGTLAVVSRLPATEYRPERIEARLEDVAWVGEQGMAHEHVVLWFVDESDILPARLFSLYSDDAALRTALEPQQQRIAHALRALHGRREWNLKLAYDPAELARHAGAVSDGIRRMDEEIRAAPPGRSYLLQRKRADMLKREVASGARRLGGELVDRIRPLAEAVRVLPLADADGAGNVVLNAALLVHRDAEPHLRERVAAEADELGRLGMVLTFSGPWAPYRFLEDHVGT